MTSWNILSGMCRKQCVGAHSEFDFLMAIVSKAYEGGGEEADDHTGDGNGHRLVVREPWEAKNSLS